jgi:hypothetical protein
MRRRASLVPNCGAIGIFREMRPVTPAPDIG